MAPHLERYEITSPRTSRSLRAQMRVAIDNGSRTLELRLRDNRTSSAFLTEFRLRQARYGVMSTEYLGELTDLGIATITVMTHTDMDDTPARLTLARRPTP